MAGMPDRVEFASKPQLPQTMLSRVPWRQGCRSPGSQLRSLQAGQVLHVWLKDLHLPYVRAECNNAPTTSDGQRKRPDRGSTGRASPWGRERTPLRVLLDLGTHTEPATARLSRSTVTGRPPDHQRLSSNSTTLAMYRPTNSW